MIDFITKDSGERKVHSTGMQRDVNKGKPRFDLILPKKQKFKETILYRWAMLMTRGCEKYGERNWEKASTQEELDRAKDAAFRHFMQWFAGEEDEDHAAAVLFNINEVEYIKQRLPL